MKVAILASLTLGALISTSAFATSINLRHEYMPDREGDQHRDRITLAHRFDNKVGVSVEAKWKHNNDNFLRDMVSGGHEVGVNYNYKVTDNLNLQPAYAADVSSSKTTHKFSLRGSGKLTDNWSTSLRYRYGMVREPAKDNSHYHQLNLVTDYRMNWGKLGVDLEYKDLQSGKGGWKDKDRDHLINFFGEYSQFASGWIPFAEVGLLTNDKNKDGYKDDYSVRYRVGIKYNF